MKRLLLSAGFLLLGACEFNSFVADREWVWKDFPFTVCLDGLPTGIGINLNSDSDKVLVYLEAGGACFDALSCAVLVQRRSYNRQDFGFGPSTRGILGRNNHDNPFADWNLVYVPYCSGDIHAGDTQDGAIGDPQRGYHNIGEYLPYLVSTFPDASVIVLAGSSAGGFGVAYNYDRFQRAFDPVPVHMIDDSGPPLGPAFMTSCLQARWRAVWNLDATLPDDCYGCLQPDGSGLHLAPEYLATKYPDRRFGFISSTHDLVIAAFLSFGFPNCALPALFQYPPDVFQAGVYDLAFRLLPFDNAHAFILDSTSHVWLQGENLAIADEDVVSGGNLSTSSGGVRLGDWVRDLVEDAPAWRTVLP